MDRSKCWFLSAFLVLLLTSGVHSQEFSLFNGFKVLKRVYDQCENYSDTIKCLKVQALKVTDRALRFTDDINVMDGVTLVKSDNNDDGRSMSANLTPLPAMDLNKIQNNEIDNLLIERVSNFVSNHKIQLSVPRSLNDDVEGRGKKLKKYMGPLMAAILIKGGLLTMAFKGIALLAGKALLLGKIALVVSSIVAAKKLFSSDGHEKTTYEIVKHPQISHSQSYSSSHYGGDYDSNGGGGHYHRSLEGVKEEDAHEKAYSAYMTSNGY